MAKRVTIMIDDEIAKRIRIIQAKQIRESSSSVSFSKVINQQLRKVLK